MLNYYNEFSWSCTVHLLLCCCFCRGVTLALVKFYSKGPHTTSWLSSRTSSVNNCYWHKRNYENYHLNNTSTHLSILIKLYVDNEYPLITGIPENITQDTDPELPTAVVDWPEPTASDNSGSVTLTSSHVSGETFPIGITIVTYAAVDDGSNMVLESFAVLIEGAIILWFFVLLQYFYNY